MSALNKNAGNPLDRTCLFTLGRGTCQTSPDPRGSADARPAGRRTRLKSILPDEGFCPALLGEGPRRASETIFMMLQGIIRSEFQFGLDLPVISIYFNKFDKSGMGAAPAERLGLEIQ